MGHNRKPAIFLDRDGVIIENRDDYVRHWSDVVIYPQAAEALAQSAGLGYQMIIITNQSVIGRGLVDETTIAEINARLVENIRVAGGRIDAVYVCPHAPEDNCSCRKPRPGLLLRAAEDMAVELDRSILIGDAMSDIMAGQAAGVPHCYLVRTGRGRSEEKMAERLELEPFRVSDTLADVLMELRETSRVS